MTGSLVDVTNSLTPYFTQRVQWGRRLAADRRPSASGRGVQQALYIPIHTFANISYIKGN